jgi:hypothetical protein
MRGISFLIYLYLKPSHAAQAQIIVNQTAQIIAYFLKESL